MRHNSNLLMCAGILLLIGAGETAAAALGWIETDVWNIGLFAPHVLFIIGSSLVLSWGKEK